MKNKIIKDALALTLITLVAGVALGGVYEITKDPIARQEAQAKAEAYEQVFTDAAAFEEVKMDDTLIQTIRDQLDQCLDKFIRLGVLMYIHASFLRYMETESVIFMRHRHLT